MRKHSTGKEQKRHWVGTIQLGHHDKEVRDSGDEEAQVDLLVEAWNEAGTVPGLRYMTGQLERGKESGRIHLQVYAEFEQSLRESQVEKRIPGAWDFRVGTRAEARAYPRKADTRLEGWNDVGPWEHGEWKPDRRMEADARPKARALDYIVRMGLSPREIAVIDPECYFTHHRAITELYRALMLAGQIEPEANDCPWQEREEE